MSIKGVRICFVQYAQQQLLKVSDYTYFRLSNKNILTKNIFCDIMYIKVTILFDILLIYITENLKGKIMSKIIAVTSGKGGTGKSTVCAGIGYTLAKQGHRTLIIEIGRAHV